MKFRFPDRRKNVAIAVAAVVAAFAVNVAGQAVARQDRKRTAKKEESYTRPAPTRPIRPEIPSANRFRQDKIFLEYADSLFKVENRLDTVERQIVKGNVKFRQAGMWMYCDSAYYYPNLNSLDAFGNVRMEQGDTLFVYADKLFYEGNERLAKLKNGPSREKVKLVNRDVTLTTDSLDYSLAMELGWYERWGTIDDKVNTLTSYYGEYSPGTKIADFYHDVELVNNEDGYVLLTDTLHYNTETHIARIESDTEIQGENDTIFTTRGIYDTQLGNAELLSRSTIVHRDSNNNVTTLEGDSIIYDKLTRVSRAYMFSDPRKHGAPMVITDTARRTTLVGGFGIYNDSTREALASIYPLLMEYSQGDTLFLRADTIKTFIMTEMVRKSGLHTKSGFPEWKGEIIVKATPDSLWIKDTYFSLLAPMWNYPREAIAKVLPAAPEKKAKRELPAPVIQLPEKPEPESVLAGRPGEVPASIGNPETETAAEEVGDTIPMVPKEFHVAVAYHRARFFKQDIQGVADSMVMVEKDSMLYMFRKPIVWSGERQVTGNRIDVHLNDSTADWALLPESGLMSEHVGEDFYNQLSGKTMFARFADQTLKSLDVSGNVETIFLPMESDSTFNRLINAESSYLTIELDSGQMDKMKMWPEVSGTVTPLFMVKKQQQYLRQFRWWDILRPVRETVGGRLRWQDDLGEVSDELEQYFLSPSDFGQPKSFPASRPAIPRQTVIPAESVSAIKGDETEAAKEEKEISSEVEAVEEQISDEKKENSKESGGEKGEEAGSTASNNTKTTEN